MARARRTVVRQEIGETPEAAELRLRVPDDKDAARRAALETYNAKSHPDIWAKYGPELIDLAVCAPKATALGDKDSIMFLTKLWSWAELHGYPMTADTLLTPERIDAFCEKTFTGSASALTVRWRLRTIADGRRSAAEPVRLKRKRLLEPHSIDQRDLYIDAAAAMPTHTQAEQERARNVQFIVNASFGAGVDEERIHHARRSWFVDINGVLTVTDPERAIPIPVTPEFRARLLPTLVGEGDDWVLSPGSLKARGDCVSHVMEKARKSMPVFECFKVSQAARRWYVDVLQRANFDVLVQLCGIRPDTHTVSDLSAYLEHRSLADAEKVAWGWMR